MKCAIGEGTILKATNINRTCTSKSIYYGVVSLVLTWIFHCFFKSCLSGRAELNVLINIQKIPAASVMVAVVSVGEVYYGIKHLTMYVPILVV